MAKKSSDVATNVNPDDVAACFTEYSSLRADVARIQQKIAATFGRYEKLGVDKKAITHAYAQSQKDPAEAAAQHLRNSEYLAMLEIIDFDAKGQGSFAAAFADAPKPSKVASDKLLAARAYNDGYNSALAGGKIDACAHPVGSEAFVSWRDGFCDGAEDRRAKDPDADKVTKAAPRKRGRPPGNGHDQVQLAPAGTA